MTPTAQTHCRIAMSDIRNGFYPSALLQLRAALAGTSNRRAWSKLMLAIRELSRLEVQS